MINYNCLCWRKSSRRPLNITPPLITILRLLFREFPNGPVLRLSTFTVGPGSIHGRGTKISQAAQHRTTLPTNKNELLFISLMQLPWRLMFIILHVPSCSCQCFLFSLTLIKRNDLLFSEMCKSPWFFITIAWNLPNFYLFLGFACKGFPGGSVLKKSTYECSRQQVLSVSRQDPLEGEMAISCSILAWGCKESDTA